MNSILSQQRTGKTETSDGVVACQTCGNAVAVNSIYCNMCASPIDPESWLPLEPLSVPLDRIYHAVVTILPEQAEKILEHQVTNRKIKKRALENLKQTLGDGEWQMNGQTIILDRYGRLINGEHRLVACVQTGIPIEVLVVKGITLEARVTIDDGVKRNTSDQLHMDGFNKYETVCGTTLRHLCQFDMVEDAIVPQGTPSRTKQMRKLAELNRKFKEEGGLAGIVEYVSTLPKSKDAFQNLRLTSVIPCYVLFYDKDQDAAKEFVYRLTTGIDLSENSPILALRRFGNRIGAEKKKSKSGSGIKAYYLMAHIIKAWNAWVHNKQVDRIVWNRIREPFPVVAGVPDNFCT